MRSNLTPKIGDNALFENYNFTDGSRSGELISQWDIRKAREQNFYNIHPNTVEAILTAATVYEATPDSAYNFVVHEDGALELGGDMAHIASNISEFKRAWQHFLTRPHFNVIIFELEGSQIVKSCHNIDGDDLDCL